MQSKFAGLIYMLIGVAAYASIPIIIKLALKENIDPLTLLTARFAIGLVIHWTYAGWRQRVIWLSARPLMQVALLGILGHALTSILTFLALERISAAQVALLFATYPAWVTIGDRILNAIPITLPRAVGLAAGLFGSIFLTIDQSGTSATLEINPGSVMALANALSYALYLILSRRQVTQLSAEVVSPYYATSAFLVLLLLRPPWLMVQTGLQPELWVTALYIALTGGFVGVITFLKALHHISAGEAALIGILEPALTVLLAFWILAEHLAGLQWVGLLLVLLGVVIGQIKQRTSAFGLLI